MNRLPLFLSFLLVLSGCANSTPVNSDAPMSKEEIKDRNDGKLFGDALTFGKGAKSSSAGVSGITVNKYLWRASLDTISFLPLSSADPFGGVIISDWYSPNPNEKIKVTITVLSKALRADGLRISVFRKAYDSKRRIWVDKPASQVTSANLETSILTRARELKISGS